MFRPFACTDTGNAEAFAAWYGDAWRFDFQRGVWRHWESPIWAPDSDGLIYRDATAAMRRRYREAEQIPDLGDRTAASKWAISSESRARLEACLFLAARVEPIADAGATWDADSCWRVRTASWTSTRASSARVNRRTDSPCRRPRRTTWRRAVHGSSASCSRSRATTARWCAISTARSATASRETLANSACGSLRARERRENDVVARDWRNARQLRVHRAVQHVPEGSALGYGHQRPRGPPWKRFVPASEVRERAKLDEGRSRASPVAIR
jgi:hypothetical protein